MNGIVADVKAKMAFGVTSFAMCGYDIAPDFSGLRPQNGSGASVELWVSQYKPRANETQTKQENRVLVVLLYSNVRLSCGVCGVKLVL